MPSATVRPEVASRVRRIRWGRILIGGVALEAALIALAVPLLSLIDNPFVSGAERASGDFTIFFVSVAALCLTVGVLVGWWVARPLASRFVLHGALTGLIATGLYLAICSIPPTTIATVFAAYGPFWFLAANGLRILGSTLGAAYGGRRR